MTHSIPAVSAVPPMLGDDWVTSKANQLLMMAWCIVSEMSKMTADDLEANMVRQYYERLVPALKEGEFPPDGTPEEYRDKLKAEFMRGGTRMKLVQKVKDQRTIIRDTMEPWLRTSNFFKNGKLPSGTQYADVYAAISEHMHAKAEDDRIAIASRRADSRKKAQETSESLESVASQAAPKPTRGRQTRPLEPVAMRKGYIYPLVLAWATAGSLGGSYSLPSMVANYRAPDVTAPARERSTSSAEFAKALDGESRIGVLEAMTEIDISRKRQRQNAHPMFGRLSASPTPSSFSDIDTASAHSDEHKVVISYEAKPTDPAKAFDRQTAFLLVEQKRYQTLYDLCKSEWEMARGTADEHTRMAEMREASDKLKEHLRMDIRKELPLFFPPKTAVPPPVVSEPEDVLRTPTRAVTGLQVPSTGLLNNVNPATLCYPHEIPDPTWDDNWYGSCMCVCMFARIDQLLVQPHLARQCLCLFS
jgi:hypothetical protein